MVARMRHIAILVEDPEKSAQFFESAFGMQRAGKAGRGLYMSDGTINIALLKVDHSNPKEKVGLYHFGMWVDDLKEAEKTVTAAGGTYLAGRPDELPEHVLRSEVSQPGRRRVRPHPQRLARRGEGGRAREGTRARKVVRHDICLRTGAAGWPHPAMRSAR